MNPQKTLRFGVIGAGRIGKIHAENLATRIAGVEIAAIADVNLAAAQEVAARLHIPQALEDYHAILADPSIDAVALC
ncbi:MAG: Gfo/Idh/MocA family oxidoreductase, partial [Anaerolineaceae bacterium]|nr:Gfo/Idh/MocA family oxidoreductase [Anaerolineaceae bacterium]